MHAALTSSALMQRLAQLEVNEVWVEAGRAIGRCVAPRWPRERNRGLQRAGHSRCDGAGNVPARAAHLARGSRESCAFGTCVESGLTSG